MQQIRQQKFTFGVRFQTKVLQKSYVQNSTYLQTLKLIKHAQNHTLTMYHILLDKAVYSYE